MKDDHTRRENTGTDPLTKWRAFNVPEVVTEGWYPALPSRDVPRGAARSVVIGAQRLVVWRGDAIHAFDAFCPHMGADLANGRVVGDTLECYFHRFRYGATGELVAAPCARLPNTRARAWPVEEKYGFIWIYAGDEAPYGVPDPPRAEGPWVAWHLGSPTLFAHHHVMMVGGIDQQHFAAVHGLDVRFEEGVTHPHPGVADWVLAGDLPPTTWRGRLGRWLLGPRIGYDARFAGGSVVTLTYGTNQRRVWPLHVLWGCVALPEGVSRVEVFLVAPRKAGLLTAYLRLAMTALLLGVLRDDDVKAFPNMRFTLGHLSPEDSAVARLAKWLDELPISPWTPR